MDRTFVAIDVETTGLEAGVDEIIEVAAVKFRGDEVLETFSQLVKPRHSLPLKTLHAEQYGRPFLRQPLDAVPHVTPNNRLQGTSPLRGAAPEPER